MGVLNEPEIIAALAVADAKMTAKSRHRVALGDGFSSSREGRSRRRVNPRKNNKPTLRPEI
jgi:hypothetical protein